MHYKTITLELIRDRAQWHEQLRLTRQLLPTMEQLARELREAHQQWTQTLTASRPESEPSLVSSEALELAVRELEERLPNESSNPEGELPELENATASPACRTSSD